METSNRGKGRGNYIGKQVELGSILVVPSETTKLMNDPKVPNDFC